MISLRKYLDSSADKAGAFFRGLSLLIQGIGLHSIAVNEDDHAKFRSDIDEILRQLDEDPNHENVLVLTGAANKALEEYNRRAAQHFRMHHAYLHQMISMLSHTIVDLGKTSQSLAVQLQEVERKIERAYSAEDFLTLKNSLADHLRAIREEHQKQRDDTVRNLSGLKQQLEAHAKNAPGFTIAGEAEFESATGFPTRKQAERVLLAAIEAGDHAYAAVFAAERYRVVTDRFGRGVADNLVFAISEQLATNLSPADQFFSWDHSAILVFMLRVETLDIVKRQVAHALASLLDITVQVQQREVMLPVRAAWIVLPVFGITFEALLHKIDFFVSSQT
ncbi:MAG: diguanylate cyclase [Acidobacteria bacterium]|nr:diguanylate cyclase [Acidobacteriota bacterium]